MRTLFLLALSGFLTCPVLACEKQLAEAAPIALDKMDASISALAAVAPQMAAAASPPPSYWLYRKVYNPATGQVLAYCQYTTLGQIVFKSWPQGYNSMPFNFVANAPLDPATTLPFTRTAIGLAASSTVVTTAGQAGALQVEYGGYDVPSNKSFILQGTGATTVINPAPQNSFLIALIDALCIGQ